MLTGEPPFTGITAQAVVARVLTETPRPLMHRSATRFRRTWRRRCSPRSRSCRPTASRPPAEFAEALKDKSDATTVSLPPRSPRRDRPRAAGARRMPGLRCPRSSPRLPWSRAAALWGWLRPGPGPARDPVQPRAQAQPGAAGAAPTGGARIAPLARRADSGVQRPGRGREPLWLRRLDQLDATPIAGTEGGSSPFFSPDGQRVGFVKDGTVGADRLARRRADRDADRQGQHHLGRLGRRRLHLLRGGLGHRPDARHRRRDRAGLQDRTRRRRRSRPSGRTCCPARPACSSGSVTWTGASPISRSWWHRCHEARSGALARPRGLRRVRADGAPPRGDGRRKADRHSVRPEEAGAHRRTDRADRGDRRARRRLQHRPCRSAGTARWPTPPAAHSAPAAPSG